MTLFAVGPIGCMIPILLAVGPAFYMLTRDPPEPPKETPWPAHWPR